MNIDTSNVVQRMLAEEKNKKRISRCRPIILALWPEIYELIKGGWSLKSIWRAFVAEEKYFGSYTSFCIHVQALQKEQSAPKAQEIAAPEKEQEQEPKAPAPVSIHQPATITGFKWDERPKTKSPY